MPRALIVGALLVAASTITLAQRADRCPECLWARYWTVPLPTGACRTTEAPCFPETDVDWVQARASLGVSFSGGGTRSASATLGQLRGLQKLGLLARVRYVSAVSGGAWAAVPFTFSKSTLDAFLGRYQLPSELTMDALTVPNGALAATIGTASLAAGSVREVAGDVSDAFSRDTGNQLLQTIVATLNGSLRRESDRLNKTYARLLGRVFIDPLVEPNTSSSGRLFSWTPDTVRDIAQLNNGRIGNDMVVAGEDRPFLIAGGTVIAARQDYAYPLLMPIEYTPMYVGVRNRFSPRFGGTYISPWAFDADRLGDVNRRDHLVQVHYDPKRSFTLADVIASVGAAPQLTLVLGDAVPASFKSRVQQAAQFFPSFRQFAISDDLSIRTVLTEEIGHGDGGFSDNLGVMPLLARGVRNMLVFDNTNSELAENDDDLKSLFFPIGPPNGTGDKTHNHVFDSSHYQEVIEALAEARNADRPQVYCTAQPWTVLPNTHYGVGGYDGVNVCLFYNSSAAAWRAGLPEQLRRIAAGTDTTDAGKGFEHFPWFSTFYLNRTHIIQLTTPQVNLLSNLTAWIVANDDTRRLLDQTLHLDH